ncbi:MAG: hypothetical protein PHQ58_02000 [Rhodoferax sp.]|uniref:hypothetical protein n=1 Tax=Rhodoferax sp. TaxID=50421 RepID=UPI002614D3A2|nr:hypothetical protein [Rhodoferax sp.]MDD2879185.1 hypothetical protein [Rhodoferax sp.]
MRGWFGLVGLLLALVIVGTLVRKQMTAVRVTLPTLETPAIGPANASPTPGNVAQQNQQIQQQMKQAVESAMQARPMPDDK